MLVLLAGNLQQIMVGMKKSLKEKAIKMNAERTKVIVFGRYESLTECNVAIEGENVEQVKEIVYLDSMLTRNGRLERNIELR